MSHSQTFADNANYLVNYICDEIEKLNAAGKTKVPGISLLGMKFMIKSYKPVSLVENFIDATWAPSPPEGVQAPVPGELWNKIFEQDGDFMQTWSAHIIEKMLSSKTEEIKGLLSAFNATGLGGGLEFKPDAIKKDFADIFYNHLNTEQHKKVLWKVFRYLVISTVKFVFEARRPVIKDGQECFLNPDAYKDVKIMGFAKKHQITLKGTSS